MSRSHDSILQWPFSCVANMAFGYAKPLKPVPAQIKQTLLENNIVDDNAYCHILSGLGAGFFAVICGSPVDVVKSRMMGAQLHKTRNLSYLPNCSLPTCNGRA